MVSLAQCSLIPQTLPPPVERSEDETSSVCVPILGTAFIIGGCMMDSAPICYMPLGGTVAQVAIAWLMHKPGVSSVIIGARTLQQLEDNLKSAFLALTAEEVRELVKFCALLMLWAQTVHS